MSGRFARLAELSVRGEIAGLETILRQTPELR